MSSSTRKKSKEVEIPEAITMRSIQQMFAQFNAYMNKSHENLIKKLNVQDPEELELFNIQAEKVREDYESQIFIEPFTKPLTLPPAEPVTKPAPQPSELTPPQSLPFASETFTLNVARVAKEHDIRHRVIERIGFRSSSSPLASCSAFVHLGHLGPAAALPFSSWAFTLFTCAGQWELSDHG